MIRCSTLIAFGILTVPAVAADVTSPSHIDAITVFPDQAQVTRTLGVTLGKGDQTLVINDLPVMLDASSLHVEATGSASIMIGSVDVRRVTPPPAVPLLASDVQQHIDALLEEHANLDDKIAAADAKRQLIETLGKAASDGFVKGISEGKTAPSQLKDTWDTFGAGLADELAAIRAAQKRQRDINDEIARIKDSAKHLPDPQKPHDEARIALSSADDGDATFKVTYRIGAAGWQPLYDARLLLDTTGGKPKVDLTTRALVTQATGEDWKDAELTLSTARPSLGTSAPDLKPTIVRLWQPAPPVAAMAPAPAPPPKTAASAKEVFRFSGGTQFDAPANDGIPKPAQELVAQIETNGLTTVFHVPGRVTVETGTGARNLKIGSTSLDAKLSAKAVPATMATAYLTAEFRRDGDAAMLPGRVSIYRGGEFVGTGQIPFTGAGDAVKLGFGEDDKVKVERIALKQTEGDTGIFGSTHQETHDFKIRAKNLHADIMPITIEDQIPVSEATEITIDRLSTTTAPTKVNADDRRGVLAWSFDLKPSEEKEIRVGWRMKYPADRQLERTAADH